MKKFLKSITLVEWLIWGISVISIIVSFFAFKKTGVELPSIIVVGDFREIIIEFTAQNC